MCGELSEKPKNGLKSLYCTLPNCWSFQKCEFSPAHETHFKPVQFNIRGANSTFVVLSPSIITVGTSEGTSAK